MEFVYFALHLYSTYTIYYNATLLLAHKLYNSIVYLIIEYLAD